MICSNRIFKIAFLVSLAWHLFCMSFFKIVVLPGRYHTRDLTKVSFLGPILEKTALEIMLVGKPTAVSTSYHHNLKYGHRTVTPQVKNDSLEVEPENPGMSTEPDSNFDFLKRGVLESVKEVPRMAMGREEDGALSACAGEDPDTGEREIIYKGEKPKLPSWIDSSSAFYMELEFVVNEQGDVQEIAPKISSGNPEVDLIGIRYLKSWRFAPSSAILGREDRRSVKLYFEAQR